MFQSPSQGFLDRLRIELRMVGQLQDAGLNPKDALTVSLVVVVTVC